jgi:hypothetical protein
LLLVIVAVVVGVILNWDSILVFTGGLFYLLVLKALFH